LKTKVIASAALVAVVLAICIPAFAHHGAAAYDMTKPVMLKDAVITKYSWINPHALILFDYKDEKGNVQHWTTEIGSPAAVALVGWTRTSLKPGDVVTVYVWQSKTRLPVGRLNKIVLSNGTLLRDSQTGADNGGRADNDVK
jgi:uncharacterized protein DUF6152